jgi:hypothetical protein
MIEERYFTFILFGREKSWLFIFGIKHFNNGNNLNGTRSNSICLKKRIPEEWNGLVPFFD